MMRGSVRALLSLCLLMGIMAVSAQVLAAQADQVILVLWHGLEWEDLGALALDEHAYPIAYGLLNTRSGGGESQTGAYLSLGAGARAVGWSGAAAFSSGEMSQGLYRLHTGEEPALFVQPDLALIQGAQKVSYRVELGALGSALLQGGVPPRVLGSSDGNEPYRWGALVGMERLGRVFSGNLSSGLLQTDPAYPYGQRTDYDQLLHETLKAAEPLVIVDLGDPYRFDQYQQFMVPNQRERLRTRMLADGARFLQKLLAERPPGTLVFVVSAYPSASKAEASLWLTPILCIGWRDGLLSSGTTRWPGLITNMDLAPTILGSLEIPNELPMIGRAAFVEPSEHPTIWLTAMVKKTTRLAEQRGTILRLVVLSQIVVYSAVLASLILPPVIPSWALRLGELLLLLILLLPLALLLWDGPVWLLATLPLALFGLHFAVGSSLKKVGILTLVTILVLTFDLLRGSWFMRYSPLGYDPIGGARFYGLGNEFMGVFVGASVMAWSIFAQRLSLKGLWPRLVALFGSAAIVFLIGSPSLGTNVGGAICAVFALGSTWLMLYGDKSLGWTALLLGFAVVFVLVVLMLVDHANPSSEQSHIGQTVALFRRDGFLALQLIIYRKLAMNFKLLRYSIWSRALLVALVVMGASFIWPSRFIYWLNENHPQVAKGMAGVVIGSVAAFVFNDSGVVAAATCLTFAATTLLLLALELKHNFNPPEAYVKNDANRD